MTVFIQGGVGQPTALIEKLAQSPEACRGVEFVAVMTAGLNDFVPTDFHPDARFTTFFMFDGIGRGEGAARTRYMPMHYSRVPRFLRALPRIDVALIQVSAPGADDRASLGLSADFVPDLLDKAGCVVAEVNRRMPSTRGNLRVPMRSLDIAVECEHELPEWLPPAPTPEVARIASNVAGLIADGSTLQIGIGKVPEAVLARLSTHRRLGLHSGLLTEGTRQLIEQGVLTGEAKSIDRNLHVAGMAMGSRAFYDWVATNRDIELRPVTYTHEARILGQVDQLVAVNSAVQVDLYGQANCETVRGRQISGTGGILDFSRGARLSAGGYSILALPATAGDGSISRICAQLDDGIATLARTDVDYVVTEHGVADVANGDTHRRARALTDIAAPRFRDELWKRWEARQK